MALLKVIPFGEAIYQVFSRVALIGHKEPDRAELEQNVTEDSVTKLGHLH